MKHLSFECRDSSNNRLTEEIPANGSFVPPPPVSTQGNVKVGSFWIGYSPGDFFVIVIWIGFGFYYAGCGLLGITFFILIIDICVC
ncbi:hypothetical protein CKAN_02196400 [Cinnamomum micranthum f. kanehirae]|uniref:Uncharacterized protein n=1 Tax=Cinnamomum micranthum f. kanehirae TaxID=337451 RepID=A0A3S3PKL7_9MAGN|nr:hypothetical protein CKAN_02196400 [Cinnamomum micranthum f. kanehirae]